MDCIHADQHGCFHRCIFPGTGDEMIYGVLVFLSGSALAPPWRYRLRYRPDAIDYDELLTGERREGQYIGLWSISKKFAAAIGIGAGLTILGMAGYSPNTEQPPQVVFTLRVLYALVPSICNFAAILIAFAYPISSRVHADIREAIARQKQGLPMVDPLKPVTRAG